MSFLQKLIIIYLFFIQTIFAADGSENVVIEVWKSPSCICCNKWIKHLKDSGFDVKAYNNGNNSVRSKFGIDNKFASCHTAYVNGYIIEGHVPANDIKKLLLKKPKAIGLAVPGMPVGSPGMDGPEYEGKKDKFDVLILQSEDDVKVFNSY
jgi:hypothetical protein